MQMLEPNDMVAAGAAFDFDIFGNISASTPATDAIQTFDMSFGSTPELSDTPSSSSSNDPLSFNFASNAVSVSPSSIISLDAVSEYAQLSPLFQSTKAICAESNQASMSGDDEVRVYSASVQSIALKYWMTNGNLSVSFLFSI